MSESKLIGIMLVRNEADIIEEVMEEYVKQEFEAIYVLDSSDDNTLEIIKQFGNVKYAVKDKDVGLSPETIKDGARQILFDKAVEDYGYANWFFSLQGDEIFHNSVRETVRKTNPKEYNLINCLVADFVIHASEKDTVDNEDITIPIQKRRLWYYLRFQENSGFYVPPHSIKDVYYDVNEHMRVIPRGQLYFSSPFILLRKHYQARSPKQLEERIEDRIKRNWQGDYKRLSPIFVSHINEIKPQKGDIYSSLNKLDGKFRIKEQYKNFINSVVDGEKFMEIEDTEV